MHPSRLIFLRAFASPREYQNRATFPAGHGVHRSIRIIGVHSGPAPPAAGATKMSRLNILDRECFRQFECHVMIVNSDRGT